MIATIPSSQDWAEFVSLLIDIGFGSDDLNAVLTVWLMMLIV